MSSHFQPQWEVNSQKIKIDSLIVRHVLSPPNEVPAHKSNYIRMAYQLSDRTLKNIQMGEDRYVGNFERGDFCLHPASCEAGYSWLTTSEVVAISMKPDFLRDIAEQSECLNPDGVELIPILKTQDPILSEIAVSFLREMNLDLGSRLYSETLATQLAIHLLRKYSTVPLKIKSYTDGLSPTALQAAIDYVQANLETKIGLKDLAQTAEISSSHFLRLFKQSTGITPYQYITQQRIELAKSLLKQKQLPIIEIAISCGFASQSSFSKTFCRVVGVTPNAYRKQQ